LGKDVLKQTSAAHDLNTGWRLLTRHSEEKFQWTILTF